MTHATRSTRTCHLCAAWSWPLLGILTAGLLACGGGDSVAAALGSDGTAKPAGLLWHSDFALNAIEGSYTNRLPDGASSRIDPLPTASPSHDGSVFATFDYDVRHDVTVVAVKRVAGSQPIASASFNGYVRDLHISPTSNTVLLVRWGSSAISTDDDWVVVDLANRSIRNTLPGGNAGASWLPDGRFLHVGPNRTLVSGSVGSTTLAPAGQINVPDRRPRGLWVNPQGTRLLVRLVAVNGDGQVTSTDLWAARLDGGDAQRYTNTGFTTTGTWSPDGRQVGFDYDLRSACDGVECSSVVACELYRAPGDGRNLTTASATVGRFAVRDNEGAHRTLACVLRGWTH